jgi:hypothetical protein
MALNLRNAYAKFISREFCPIAMNITFPKAFPNFNYESHFGSLEFKNNFLSFMNEPNNEYSAGSYFSKNTIKDFYTVNSVNKVITTNTSSVSVQYRHMMMIIDVLNLISKKHSVQTPEIAYTYDNDNLYERILRTIKDEQLKQFITESINKYNQCVYRMSDDDMDKNIDKFLNYSFNFKSLQFDWHLNKTPSSLLLGFGLNKYAIKSDMSIDFSFIKNSPYYELKNEFIKETNSKCNIPLYVRNNINPYNAKNYLKQQYCVHTYENKETYQNVEYIGRGELATELAYFDALFRLWNKK